MTSSLPRIWTGALLPPAAWAFDLLVSLMLTRTVVATERRWPLFLVSLISLGLALVGITLCRRALRAHPREEHERELPADLALARWGMALGAFFVLLIAAMAVPSLILRPRDLP
jgi:hypothetical protein